MPDENFTLDELQQSVDFHALLLRALDVYKSDIAMEWLFGSEPFLDGARPIDVLVHRGVAPLIEALNAIEAGAYP